MVKIQKLVLKNFKSFKNAEVPIADGFTVIAGSNGSGKSNILDGLLFGMGATSLKTMRASRLTELVNSSAGENYAKVDIQLKHEGKTYDISRMIDKQGKCIYRLDGNKVTLGEISSLLRELNIRTDGHNIVMQGDVTRVIEMSPEERRQIIDELAGLQEFDEKKEEALKNLDKVETKVRDTNIVLHERENYLQDLEKERESALLFDSLGKEKKEAKATILFSEISKIKGKLKENAEKVKEAKEKREELLGKVGENEARLGADKEKARQLNGEIISANERIFSTLGAKLEEKRSEINVASERLDGKKQIIERNDSKTEELREKIKRKVGEKKGLEDEKVGVESELPIIEKNIKKLKEQMSGLEEGHAGKQGKIEELESEIRALAQKSELLKREEISKQGEANNLRHRQSVEKEKIQALLADKKAAEKKIEELEKQQALLESVYSREKDPEDALERARNALERGIGKSKERQAEINAFEEKALLLQKQIAECPVCDSPLDSNKKKQLLMKAKDGLKTASLDLARLADNVESARTRIKDLETLVFKERDLKIELKQLPVERTKNKELEEKINEAKDLLGEKSISMLDSDAEKAKEQASQLLAKKESLETKRNEMMAALQLGEMNKLNSELSSLQTKKSLSNQRLEQIEIALGSRIEKESREMDNEIEALKAENESLEAEINEGEKRCAGLEKEVAELEKNFAGKEAETKDKMKKKEELEKRIEDLGERISSLYQKMRSFEQQENQVNIENSGLEVKLEDLEEEFTQFENEKRLKEFDTGDLSKRLGEIERQMQSLGAINMKAIESFNELAEEVRDVRAKVEKLEEEKFAVLGMIEKIEVKRTSVFMECFDAVNKHFSKTFLHLFEGEGLLSLSNIEAPLEAGLIIEANHKGKSLQNIDSMSGGEKTLTALAFLFAIQLYEPAPFYVFDEADAALDKENSLKMVKIIKEISKESQFIAITHNDPLIKEADQIIGVALNKQKSSVIGLKLKERVFDEKA